MGGGEAGLRDVGDDAKLGIVLWTTDVPALARFFKAVAGLTVEALHPGFASLRVNGSRIDLHSDEAYRGHPWFDALTREGVARGIGTELHLRVANVDAAYDAALRLGALAVEAPCDVDDTRGCQVMGPDGFLLSLWQPASL
jgi:catechol 2,3-dioxygenase-like lactoylglutathione lyase family enzyme